MVPSHRSKVARRNSGSCFSGSAKRPWRTVKPARRYAPALVIDESGEPRTHHTAGFNSDHRGKDAGKIRMQRAARIREICAVVMMRRAMIMDMSMIMRMLTDGVRDYKPRRWLLYIGARR